MMRNRIALVAVAVLLAPVLLQGAGMDSPNSPTAPEALGAHGLRLPATFRGDLPCADCQAIRHHLDLWPDQVFHLHREWLGRPDHLGGDGDFFKDLIGRWYLDAAGRKLVLQDGSETPTQYEIMGADRLRALDSQGRPIESDLPYELSGDGSLTPVELSLPLGGEMRYLADAAMFTTCLTGRSYPIVMQQDFAAMERAYGTAASAPGAALYVTFDGAIAPRPKMDGEGMVPSIVVHRFVSAWPDMRCERARADAALTNTYWRIVRFGEQGVDAVAGRREPHLLLRGDGRYSATVGCNRMQGGYTVEGARLTLMPAAATRMACPPPLDALERRLGEVLVQAHRWQITANTLELFDDASRPVALFEAVYF